MPLPLTVSCFSKIQIGFTFLVPAHLGSPGKSAVKRVCVCVCVPVAILLSVKKLLFWKKMLRSGSLILCRLAECCDASIFALAAKFHIEPYDVVRSSVDTY